MTLTRARSLVPELMVAEADPEGDREALHRLALWTGRRYSPVVAPDPPDGIWIDVTGCAGLFGGERALLKNVHRRIAAAGFAVQIAVADTPGCAHAVARHVPAGRPVTIEPGAQREAMALLPIAALRLEAGTIEAMRKLGFERVEQLFAAERAPLARRFGTEIYHRLDQALGHVQEPIAPVFAQHAPSCRRTFVEPIATAPAFIDVIEDLVAELVATLAARAKGARRLDCTFHRVDGHVQAIRVGTAAPSRDAAHLARLLCAKIETIDPGLGIEAMNLVASLTEPLAPLQETIARAGARGSDLSRLADTLANRFGRAKLYRVGAMPSAMPERSVAALPAIGSAEIGQWPDAWPRPSRLLTPPEPIQVTAMLPDHPPAMFVWRGARHRVVGADGPERLHGEWWREEGHEAERPYAVRDYFEVEVEGGGRYWLFRLGDGQWPATGSMRWFLHGAFA